MTAKNFLIPRICQVDNRLRIRMALSAWLRFARYLFTPEDSRETRIHQDTHLPQSAATVKSLVCLALAFGLAFALAQFQ